MDAPTPQADWLLRGSTVEVFTVQPPLYCAYATTWGRESNLLSDAFDHNPFGNHGDLFAGAPALLDAAGRFFGFLDDHSHEACRFAFDGRDRLRIRIPNGQTLVVGHEGEASWRRYNRRVLDALPWQPPATLPPAAMAIEYTTWVEQRRIHPGRAATKVVSHDFVMAYLDRLVACGMPPGRLTIGYGWLDTSHRSWRPSRERFPDFAKTLAAIRDAGFYPGVSLTPGVQPSEITSMTDTSIRHPRNPLVEESPLWPLIHYLHDVGIQAVTFDLPGRERHHQQTIYQRIHREIKEMAPDLLIELHQADLFFTPWADAVRVSDIACTPEYPWQGWSRAQYDLWYRCAPGRPINLGPIGGTHPGVNAGAFLTHLDLQRNAHGIPGVSMLGDHWSNQVSDALASFLRDTQTRQRGISDFYDPATSGVRQ